MELTSTRAAELAPRTSSAAVEVAPGIFVLRAFSPVEASAAVMIASRSACWVPAGINEDLAVDPRVRDAEMLPEELHRPHAHAYRERLLVVTSRLAAKRVPGAVLTECQLVRYHVGGRYVEHRDAPAAGDPRRVLSLVCYLNDDFAGGATALLDDDVIVEPSAGIVVAFSPARLHRAEPVTAGTKYVITAWYGMPSSPPVP